MVELAYTFAMGVGVVIIDDHPLFRDGLRAVLHNDPEITVIGDAADARAGCAAAAGLQPNVIIVDVGLPGQSGIAAIKELRRLAPDAKILMLTMHSSHEFVLQAFAAGEIAMAPIEPVGWSSKIGCQVRP